MLFRDKGNEKTWAPEITKYVGTLKFHFFIVYWEILFKEVILFMVVQNPTLTSALLRVCILSKNRYTLTE